MRIQGCRYGQTGVTVLQWAYQDQTTCYTHMEVYPATKVFGVQVYPQQ